jgi:ribosomal protein S18 acetylase RimI-like enzyme
MTGNQNIEMLKLASTDLDSFIELIELFEDVFSMENFKMPDKQYLQNLLGKNDFFVFVALNENMVVGGLTAYTLLQYYSEAPLVYIYDLAVKKKFQRKGIGRLLISEITSYCKKNGMQEVFVQADKIDDYALDFYRSTGATEEEVVHFYYPLKETMVKTEPASNKESDDFK